MVHTCNDYLVLNKKVEKTSDKFTCKNLKNAIKLNFICKKKERIIKTKGIKKEKGD